MMNTLRIAVEAAQGNAASCRRLAIDPQHIHTLKIAWSSGVGSGQRKEGRDLWVYAVAVNPVLVGVDAGAN